QQGTERRGRHGEGQAHGVGHRQAADEEAPGERDGHRQYRAQPEVAHPREGSTSWVSTPATAMVSPDAVDRKAAKAPPATRAPSRSPPTPPIISPGSSRTAASALPVRVSSGAYRRPSAP